MFALIHNNKIVGSCASQEDVDFCVGNNPELIAVKAPSDFVCHQFMYEGGHLRKKTEADYVLEHRLTEVTANRAHAYPPIGDQLDALWKGGDAAARMLAKVQAVKAKYPKPTE
jgi:hypothetical protein